MPDAARPQRRAAPVVLGRRGAVVLTWRGGEPATEPVERRLADMAGVVHRDAPLGAMNLTRQPVERAGEVQLRREQGHEA
jgi:hypothetical protein